MTPEEAAQFVSGTGSASEDAAFAVDRSAWLSFDAESGEASISDL